MLARSKKINLEKTKYYHCVTRCVRRAYLFGEDPLTKKNYDHRKYLILERLKYLSKYYSIDICAYAIMSNHVHLVLHVDVENLEKMTDLEVLEISKTLYPSVISQFEYLIIEKKISDKAKTLKIQELRNRLGSISWFMKSLNEYLARTFNKEDNCTGRFWEGRFKSQALLDERAILSAMAYVDLNPIRANISEKLEDFEFTSIYERICEVTRSSILKCKNNKNIEQISSHDINNSPQPSWLMPLKNFSSKEGNYLDISIYEYLMLVENTGRYVRKNPGKGFIKNCVKNILSRIKINTLNWIELVCNLENYFFRAIGDSNSLFIFSENSKIFGSVKAKEFFL